jgi:glycine betaine/proline transport system ATP-binding protein
MDAQHGHDTAKIEVRHLTKVFGPTAEPVLARIDDRVSKADILAESGHVVGVRDASFEVRAGEIFVIMGLSGCGKSTLIRMLNRLIEPTRGQVLIDGVDITSMSRNALIDLRRREMAMVFQSFALLPHLTAFENAAFGLDVAGVGEPERNDKVNHALETVGLTAFADRRPSDLSGGMQQRVGLARALSLDPAIMLMDEAFSALDPLIRTEMQDEMLAIQRDRGMTVVFVSHDLNEALRIADRLAIMDEGEIIQIGTPKDLVLRPANEHVHSFLKDADVRRVLTARDLLEEPPAVLTDDGAIGLEEALGALEESRESLLYVRDRDGCFRGLVSLDAAQEARRAGKARLDDAFVVEMATVSPERSFADMAETVARAPAPVPVVDAAQRLLGVVTPSAMLVASIGER